MKQGVHTQDQTSKMNNIIQLCKWPANIHQTIELSQQKQIS